MRFLVYVASNQKGLDSERYEVMRQLVRMGMFCCGFPCRDDTLHYLNPYYLLLKTFYRHSGTQKSSVA
jgi:hypothetical protein